MISQKVNVIAWVEFELGYLGIIVKHVSHHATETSSWKERVKKERKKKKKKKKKKKCRIDNSFGYMNVSCYVTDFGGKQRKRIKVDVFLFV